MKPDRSNYEIWLIDWLDGKLSESDAEELRRFLELNPDLQEEFNELSSVNLNASSETFSRKKQVQKDTSQLTDSQFELLCAGYLEGDLNNSQISELEEITSLLPEKRKIFEQIQKTKLTAPKVVFLNKRRLLKTSPFQKVIRISAISLSAAAAIFLFFISLPGKNTELNQILSSTSVAIANDSAEIHSGNTSAVNKITEPAATIKKPKIVVKKKDAPLLTEAVMPSNLQEVIDSIQTRTPVKTDNINIVSFTTSVEVSHPLITNNLIASADIPVYQYDYDETPKLTRFIAKTFREKILGEKSSGEAPLKGYEIAEAGVSGLNKLLGWDMSLEKNIDTKGELNSVYFSSKLVSFNTPVKNSVPVP
jgi:hypothetical protein